MQFLKKLRNFECDLLVYTLFLFVVPIYAGAQITDISRQIRWNPQAVSKPDFEGAHFDSKQDKIPLYQELIKLSGTNIREVSLISELESDITEPHLGDIQTLTTEFSFHYSVALERGVPYLIVDICPIRKNGNQIRKLDKFLIRVNYSTEITQAALKKKPIYASNSVLATGEWIKMGTMQNGIYRIDYGTLKNLGFNPDQLDPKNLRLYGRGAGMLPQPNEVNRIDDLKEIAIFVQGENDNKFNPGDYLLFYGESQSNQWLYDAGTQTYSFTNNLYCDTTYYFLTIGNSPGKRMASIPSATGENMTLNTYTHLYAYNNDKSNLIKSGKVWVGEEFDRITQQNFNVSIPNLLTTEPIQLRSGVTARSFVNSQFQVSVNGNMLINHALAAVGTGYDVPFTCGLSVDKTTFLSNTSNFTINYSYNKPSSGSIGWLDFFEIQAKAELKNVGGNFVFKDAANLGAGKVSKYNIGSNRSLNVLDVSDPLEPYFVQGTFNANVYSFVHPTDSLKTFAVYDGTNFLQVIACGKIANQNLHALNNPDGFIITHPLFIAEAKRLAEHHKTKSNLVIHVVNIQDIYNEFSGGTPDLSAVRDFLRMFYKRANTPNEMPKYAALFGRASYDYKYRQKPNTNFIPTFESWESFSPTSSYCSDDYLGFLDDNEGKWDIGFNGGELLDIGIGRLPVTTASEADLMVNKIISYTSDKSFGSWRNKLVFSADDEDENTHQNQSETLTNNLMNTHKEYNFVKIYLDAYKKESTAGGARFPDAQKAINHAIQSGCLIFNYTGHGGEVGLTAERVMGIDDINKWSNGIADNSSRLPLFLTATCEFSRFDDPSRYAAGEQALLNPVGGAIGLFTTVRLVYSGQNAELNKKFFENIGFDSISQLDPPRLGDVARKSKNAYLDANTRNFTLLGDPFLKLAYANFDIVTTQINGKDINVFNDTLKALKKFEVSGVIKDKAGNTLNTYQGEVYPIVYDKLTTYSTLGNNPPKSTPMSFGMQNNVLYRGKASVINGQFNFSFVVPKDIAYEYGYGKISYYANNELKDANGYYDKIFVGGTSDSVVEDKNGPQIKLYLNDVNFVNGGITNENPKLIAGLYDENGINTTGRGIGRDLMFILDDKPTKAVVVNDYYQASLNSYQSGEVKYDISNLEPGKHQLKFKAFDVYNNMSEAVVDFEVKSSEKPAIAHLLNYPNPFNNATTFHFDHNLNNQEIQVMIQIFTISGKLVKTLQNTSNNPGTHFDKLNWDGRDEFGDKLANGVYVYTCRLKSPGNKTVEKTEKLVILN